VKASRRDAFVLAILGIVPLLLFADVLCGIDAFYVRDMLHYHFPCKKILRDIVLGGHFPYWNPWFSAGQPMAANPAHEVFYPLTWLILLPDYVYALQLLPLLHLVIATFTMYALLRSMDLGRPAAAAGALSFGISGLLCSMTSLLHFLFSVSWLPLTCLFARRALLRRSWRDGALAAIFFGLQLLAGEPTTVLQTGILLGLYAIHRGLKDERTTAAVARKVAAIGAISIGAALIAAVLVIPMLDHFRDTARARGIDYSGVSRWSMPFPRVAELVYPTVFGRNATRDNRSYWGSTLYAAGEVKVPFYFSIYAGLLLTAMAAAGVLARSRGSGLFLAIAATSVILAAGDHTPLLRILYDAGVAASLRYPEKFVLMLVVAIIVFGAQSLDRLLAGDARIRRMAFAFLITTTLFAALAMLFTFTSAYEPFFRRLWGIPAPRALGEMLALSREGWLTATAYGVVLLLLLASMQRIRRPLWAAMALAFVVVDLGVLAAEVAPRVPMSFYREAPVAATRFPRKRDDFRIFHLASWTVASEQANFYLYPRPELYWMLRNALAPATPAAYGLHTAMGIDFDGTELVASSEFSQAMFALAAQRPKEWLHIAAAMSNIRYVGVYRPPDEAIAQAGGVLRNIEPVKFLEGPRNPRYYFASEMAEAGDVEEFVRKLGAGHFGGEVAFVGRGAFAPARGVVRAVHEWNNGARIDVEAAGRAFLVMSMTPHKYWRVTVDGKPADAVVTNVGYQGVVVPAGRHAVEMRYRNPLIDIGAAISLAALAAVAFLFVFCRMRGL
jgi:hypothetical protein